MATPRMAIDPLRFLEQLQSDTDVMDEVSAYAPSRSRGAGARVSIGSSGGTAIPQMAAQFMGESQAQSEAADDGTQGPVAAKSHALAYMNDPQWQHWDKMRSGAVNNMKGGGGFWGWATGGRYNAALGQEAQYADYMARQIEKRYLDMATVRAANQEQFDFSQPSKAQVWNEADRKYYDQYVGSKGGVKRIEAAPPQKTTVDQFGRPATFDVIPGGTPMVTDPTKSYTGYESSDSDVPAFSGGRAEAYAPMAPLGPDPKTQSEIAENKAQEKKALAEAGKAAEAAESPEYVSATPGSVVYDKRTGKRGFSVPQTASQRGEKSDSASGDEKTYSYDEALKIVMTSVGDRELVPGQRAKQIQDGMKLFGWDTATKKRIEPAAPAAAPSGGVEKWGRNEAGEWVRLDAEAQPPSAQAKAHEPTVKSTTDSAREAVSAAGAGAKRLVGAGVEGAGKVGDVAKEVYGAVTNPLGFARRMRDKYL